MEEIQYNEDLCLQGKPIGLFTLAADMLHMGHVNAIKAAAEYMKNLGGFLYTAISTDKAIEEYKFKPPTVPFEYRFPLAQITCKGISDNIIVIPQENVYAKAEMCKKLGVNILFTSAEYQRESYEDPSQMNPKEIAGVERWERFEQEVGELGVSVVYMPRTDGISSSQIKQTILTQCGAQESQRIMLYNEGECCNEKVFSL
jgi:glycerol-3-phosphate cytidylyltransferase-like family protein